MARIRHACDPGPERELGSHGAASGQRRVVGENVADVAGKEIVVEVLCFDSGLDFRELFAAHPESDRVGVVEEYSVASGTDEKRNRLVHAPGGVADALGDPQSDRLPHLVERTELLSESVHGFAVGQLERLRGEPPPVVWVLDEAERIGVIGKAEPVIGAPARLGQFATRAIKNLNVEVLFIDVKLERRSRKGVTAIVFRKLDPAGGITDVVADHRCCRVGDGRALDEAESVDIVAQEFDSQCAGAKRRGLVHPVNVVVELLRLKKPKNIIGTALKDESVFMPGMQRNAQHRFRSLQQQIGDRREDVGRGTVIIQRMVRPAERDPRCII